MRMSNDDKPGTPKDSHYARLRRAHRDATGNRPHAMPRPRPGGTPPEAAPDGLVRLYGLHTVRAALDNPRRRIVRLMVTRNALARLGLAEPLDLPFPAEIVEPRALDRLLGADAVHAFGAGALITTARHSPAESGVLAKAASGALEHIDLIEVRNLADALGELHTAGFQTVGLDSDGPAELEQTLAGGRIALVLGAEGKGLRQKTRETVTALARLDMPGAIRSLNVSNAAAVALYAARKFLGAGE
jgi:23S rRNA (guanosine2251-2'-O)-methyltransferase